ncbi:MAG: general secretion pathway protein GspE [Candidatus Xenobia bacterium]
MSQIPHELARLLDPPDDYDARPVVELLVRLAREAQASDLHLRPTLGEVEVLLRCDGVLQPRFRLPETVYPRLLVGLKNMARLASYRRSVPQDGQFQFEGQDVRVATAPSHFGEKVVLRLIQPATGLRRLEELGLTPTDRRRLETLVRQPQGLVLAVGPAGSGKTTTLFAALEWLYRTRQHQGIQLNVVTLEDPVEIVWPEFTQTQIQPAAGMTFASGLRSILRQDPEVILVGEIRDAETASAAVQCGLTGHLVLSTLHARDSVGAIPRLLELEIQPYLLGAALLGVIYQRLLRRLCPQCHGGRCPACVQTGYRGRLVVSEVLEVNEEIRQAILDRQPLERMRELAVENQMVPLEQTAARLVAEGLTDAEEVERVIPGACKWHAPRADRSPAE